MKKKLNSSAIESIEYDEDTHEMTVTMVYDPPKSYGAVTTYLNVPYATFLAFEHAKSAGAYFAAYVRNVFKEK